MPKFVNRGQMKKASDKELELFFEETVFEGIFSKEIKGKNTEFYKGSITNIKIEGRTSSLTPLFLNVPRTSNNIPEGPCSFKCRMNIPAFREEIPRYILNLRGNTLQSISAISAPSIAINYNETKEQDLFEMWGVDNCQCIGFYHYDEENEVYLVDDLRKPNFDHIPYYPGDKDKKPISISYSERIGGIRLNDYYLFTWKLSHKNAFNPYEIVLDFDTQRPKPIEPKWFIDTLFDDRHNDKSKNFGSAANFLDTLSKQLSAKESTFIYELLQNANDYPVEGKTVDVEFHITDNYLLFLHSGEKFNVRNISGICGINEKEKTANKKTIGYKGIGFKTVFLKNHYVYLRTGKYSFRFDEGEMPEKKMGGRIRRLGAPFQILPIWTTHNEVASEVNAVFDHANKKFQVQIALRPEDKNILHIGKQCYENLFKDIFADANIILFIPNINSVKVFINGKEERVCLRKNEEWVVGDYEEEIPFELQESINKTIDKGNSRIPEKYKDFDYTKVSFACKHDGKIIKPIDKAILYCYLPTKASWGLPFLMNTDMIPKGDRNDIETEVKLANADESNFNEELAAIAGKKLFIWIKDLLTSKRYQLGSVFSLIPDFKKCKKEHDFYDIFIERFEESFDTCVEEMKIVPVKQGIANVKNVILDTTGLSSSGIISDEDFYKFTGKEDYFLPLPILRTDKFFNTFLKRYADDNQKFTKEDLKNIISEEGFQEWLKDQDNNNKFLKYLLDNDYFDDFLNEKIFLEDEGNLFAAKELFYDVDKYLVDLQAFTNHIYFLSKKTREFFNGNEAWDKAINDKFATFVCDDFVDDVLLSKDNIKETNEKLKDKETSVHFYKFLAENVGFSENYLSLPFINEKNNVVENFSNKFLFITSERGLSVCASSWLSNINIEFISDSYSIETKTYFKDNFEVCDYSDDVIVNDIILSKDYKEDIANGINNDFDISYDFIKFCYNNRNLIQDNKLSCYCLKVKNCAGEDAWYCVEDGTFFRSTLFDYYAKKEWIDKTWMASLDESYFKDITISKDLRDFIGRTFGVEELTDKSFYLNIVKNKNNLKEILNTISGQNDVDGHKNIDFIKYLDDNYQLIFVDRKDSTIYNDLVLVRDDLCDISINANNLYLYDEEVKGVIDNDWFPKDIVYLTHPNYGSSNALIALGVKTFKLGEFFDNIIIKNIETINKTIKNKKDSVAFHNYVISHLGSLTLDQQTKMKSAKVYLYSHEEPSKISSGHKTLGIKAKELLNLGLIDFTFFDIIDPDYHTENNTEYWEARLKNTELTVKDIFAKIKTDKKAITGIRQNLNNKERSIKFYKILADNNIFFEEFLNMPFFNDSDEIVDNFKGKIIFLASDRGHEICGATWLSSIPIEFISPSYTEETRTFFKDNFGVLDFSDDIVIKKIVTNPDFHDAITKQTSDDIGASMAFVDYCYANKQRFDTRALSKYALHVFDITGESQWCSSEEEVFFSTNTYDDFSMKPWLNVDAMYSLDNSYFKGIVDKEDFKKFLIQKFGVNEIDDKKFYKFVVKKNIKSILSNINKENDSDGSKNYNFISYLDNNYQLVFTEEKDSDIFKGLTLRTIDATEVNANDAYIYDDDLIEIMSKDWFPEGIVNVCTQNYGKSIALPALGVKSFKFGAFYDDTIVTNLDEINKKVENKEQSIAFHNFIISNAGSLTDNQKAMMKGAKVYLYGHNEASPISNGHQTLSANARELFSKGLVEISDLDIIDPDYHTDLNSTTRNYWEVQLKNTKFTVNHFFIWLKDNFDIFSKTVENERKNIDFWRWLFSNNISDGLIKEAIGLPVLLKNGTTVASNALVYFSDDYLGNTVIESTLTLYDKGALILSPKYIEEGDNIDLWKIFWNKVGIKYEILNILTDTIIPTLSNIKGEYLPKLFADHRESLEKYYEQKLISHLINLLVKAHDGNFYTLRETVYIDCYDKEEPFPYIVLPNRISFETPEERRLIKDIIEEVKGTIVTTLTQWQQLKIDHYLKIQNDDAESIKEYHYCFINDLSSIRNKEQEALKVFNHIDEIQLLDRDNKFCKADTLTMGSVYKPYFDFEHCRVTTTYVSDTYNLECSEYVGKLFRKLGVKYDLLKEEDLKYLTQRTCAIYYWKEYLTKKNHFDSRVACAKNFIKSHRLDNLSCIPTKDFMKTPRELYYGSEVAKFVKNIEDWENKTPLIDLPKIKLDDDSTLFSLLPFKESLDFLDALYALTQTNSQDKRTRLLRWMIDSYEESFKSKIEEYRDDKLATWNNNQNECVQIKQLYALAYGENKLEQYFGTNPRIVNKAFFPGGESFKKACDILGIKTITTNDLTMEPDGESEYHDNDIVHKIYALVIAGKVDIDNWKDLYKHYCECLSKLVLHKCNSIKISYKKDPTISEPLFKFYHEDGASDFYFVDSLDNKHVFAPYVSEFKLFLEIGNYGKEGKKDIQLALLQDIMDSKERAIQIVNEQNSLKLDQDFITELAKLAPETAGNIQGRGIIEEPEEGYGTPGFSSKPNASEKPDSGYGNEPHKVGNIILALDEDELDCWQDYETDNLEAPTHPHYQIAISEEFVSYSQEYVEEDDVRIEVVCEHYRCGTWVRGHWRSGCWVNGYWRKGSNVSAYLRANKPAGNTQPGGTTSGPSTVEPQISTSGNTQPGGTTSGPSTGEPQSPASGNTSPGSATSGPTTVGPQTPNGSNGRTDVPSPSNPSPYYPYGTNGVPGLVDDYCEDDDEDDEPSPKKDNGSQKNTPPQGATPLQPLSPRDRKPRGAYQGRWKPAQQDTPAVRQRRNYSGYSPDRFQARQFNVGTQDPLVLSRREISRDDVLYLSRLLGRALNVATIKDENYIVRMRFYNSLKENGLDMDMDERDFVENGSSQVVTKSGKYIHRCSARSGILYISPTVWNRLREGRWIICFYSGKMADQFYYVDSQEKLMEIINQDALVIQVTGNDKREIVDKIYEDGFYNMDGNIYTLIRTIKVDGEVTPFDENITDYYNDDDDKETDAL